LKISLDWLAEYVSWDDTPVDLAAKLTSAGLNVESLEEYRQTFPEVVIARVVHRENHPDADRLSLCRVDDGSGDPVQVVCGASNVREGLTVLFARVGAVLPGDFKIKKSKIRGLESFGMICSANELGLAAEADGIMELATDLAPGTSADELYGFTDTVLDIEVTPNLPDWLSHFGVAREVAAIYGTKVSMPPVWSFQPSSESLGIQIKIKNYEDCPRYGAFGLEGVEVGPSPDWLQNRLRAIGSRPINNLVDITNYVMFELGQPMHAFDRAKLTGDTITIRAAEAGTMVTTLDEQERKLEKDTLLVCDESGPIALAGVMGLANSEVSETTTDILLESAFFNPGLVRTASRGLGLVSESSYRFERGSDWSMVEKAALRALQLYQELAGAHILPSWTNRQDPDRKALPSIPLRLWQVNRILGSEITTDLAAQHLQSLGLKVQPMGNSGTGSRNAVDMMVEIPSFRRDLFLEVDLIEEIARSYGLDNLTGGNGFRGVGGGVRDQDDLIQTRMRHWLSACGFHEIVTSSFLAAGDHERLGMTDEDLRSKTLAVINPKHGGDTQLRTTLLPSLLDVVRRNLNAGAAAPIRLFQINRTFWPAGAKRTDCRQEDDLLLPEEPVFLQFSVAGWRQTGLDGMPADLLEIKGSLEALSAHLRLSLELEAVDSETWLQPGSQWCIKDREGRIVGAAGRVDAGVLDRFDIDLPVAVAEINLSAAEMTPERMEFQPFTRFPAVRRDLSLVVPAGTAWGDIRDTVTDCGGPLLERVELFDIYRGKGVSEGRGAFGIRLKFRSQKGNLKGKTVDKAIDKVLEGLSRRLQIEPRSQD
jgi:phenylalanyl-tRNA synthetase beta chain